VQIQSERITKTSYAETFLLNLKSRNWMKLAGFATFLNRMGAIRAKCGGVLVKRQRRMEISGSPLASFDSRGAVWAA
jgi:hypothetical protein